LDKPGLSGYLVCLVFLVQPKKQDQPNKPNKRDKPDRPNRPNEQDRLADFFSILLENPYQLRLSSQLPPSGGASIPSLEGWSKYRDAVFSNCRGGQKNCEGYSENVNVSSLDNRRTASSNRLRKKLKNHLRFFLWDRVTPSDRDGGI
jgi:hypothetical protein